VLNNEYDEIFSGVFDTVTFEPLNPVTPGHRLFVPTFHLNPTNPLDLWNGGELIASVGVWRTANKLQEDFNLILNGGAAASQTIEHAHLHYVPRRPDDGLKLPWTDQHARLR